MFCDSPNLKQKVWSWFFFLISSAISFGLLLECQCTSPQPISVVEFGRDGVGLWNYGIFEPSDLTVVPGRFIDCFGLSGHRTYFWLVNAAIGNVCLWTSILNCTKFGCAKYQLCALSTLRSSNKMELVICLLYIYRVSQEESARLQESVPYVKLYRYNPEHLYPKLNGYGDNGQRKVWSTCGFHVLYLASCA